MKEDLLAEFMHAHADWSNTYRNNIFCFIACFHEGKAKIVHGAIFLRHTPAYVNYGITRTPEVVAGAVALGAYKSAIKTYRELLAGSAVIDGIHLHFITTSPKPHVQELSQTGLRENRRISTASTYGESRHSFFNRQKVDWALKAASPPFDSVSDLAAFYSIPLGNGDMSTLEAVAINPLEILNTSIVSETTATAHLATTNRLDRSGITLGVKVFVGGQCIRRERFEAGSISWTKDGELRYGTASFDVPSGALVESLAAFGGVTQHQWWFMDPARSQNQRTVSYRVIDPKAVRLREFLFDEEHQKREPAPNFEQGVATLLHLLGFAVLRVGGARKLSDAPDIIANTLSGNLAVVECTIGYPDEKFLKLLGRVQALRTSLDHAGASGPRLLPIVVTAKPRAELGEMFKEALRLKICIVCREDLQAALDRTEHFPNADQVFNDMANTLEAGQGLLNLDSHSL